MEGDFFTSLPAGYRFKPKDEELVDYYLKRKIYNRPLPPNIFRDVELYNYDPPTLTAMNDNASSNGVVTEWYFFTPRERRHPNGKRPIRTAGDGCWKATGMAKPVFSRGEKIGTKRSLVFFRGNSSEGEKTDWLMHEYVLTKAPQRQRLSSQDMQLDDWVLCRVYKKKKQRTKPGTPIEETTADEVVAHTESEPQVLGDGISPDGLNTLMPQEAFGSMLGQNPASFDPQEVVSNNANFIQMPTPLASMPPPQQFSGVNTSNDWFGLDTTQEGGDIGEVVCQGEVQMLGNGIAPIVQYQEFDAAGSLNMPTPLQQQVPQLQQQQFSGVDQSLQLQQYQPTGVDQSQPLPQYQLSGVDQSLQLQQYQFSGFDQSQLLPQQQLLGLDTTQEGGDMGAVVGQGEVQMLGNGIAPIFQYLECDATGSLNTPMPQQQQQLWGVNQSQPLQQQQLSVVNQSLQLPEQQFSGVNPSNDWFYLDTTQEEGDMGAVAGQSEVQMLGNGIAPIVQYQQFDAAGSLNMPMPQQQQQLLGVNQSQPLQQQQLSCVNQSLQLPEQQFSGVNPSNDWFYLDTTQDEDDIGPIASQSVVQMLGNGIAPIAQHQEFDASSLNMPMPQQQQVPLLQQQQPTGVDQSQQLQHQQFSGVHESNLDFTVDEEFLLDFTAHDELGLPLDF